MPAQSGLNPTGTRRGLLALGSEILGFGLLGILIDWALGTIHTVPWATLILAPLGLVVALWHLIRSVRLPPNV